MSDNPVRKRNKSPRDETRNIQIQSSSNPYLKRKRHAQSSTSSGELNGQNYESGVKRLKEDGQKQTSPISRASVGTNPSSSNEKCAESSEMTSDNLVQYIQEELTCNICSELFINPVTLNCSHSFCEFCISKWRKEHSTCPICREEITSQNSSLILDRFIEKILALLSEDTKNHRKILIELRENHENLEATSPSDLADSDTEQLVNDFLCWFGITEFMEILDMRNQEDDPDAINYDPNDNCTIN